MERIKHILILLFFLLCLGISIKLVNDGNRRLGWVGVVLWGGMSVLTLSSMIRDSFKGESKPRLQVKANTAKFGAATFNLESVKVPLVRIWTIFAAIVIGIASKLFTERIEGRLIPPLAVWVCSFFFTLIFFPFQKRQEDRIPTFPLWIVYSAVMGVVSIVFSYLEDWLR